MCIRDRIKVVHPTRPRFKITSNHVLVTSLLLSIIPLLVHFIFDYSLGGFLALCAFQFIPISIVTIIWGWNEYYPKCTIHQGSIILSLSAIEIDEQTYNFTDLKNLIFDINDYRGKRLRYPQMTHAGPCLAQGDNNFIRFNHNSTDIEVQFLLRSKEELVILGELLTQLYVNHVAFNETLTGGKSYGLENLNYKEIQEYKRKQLTSDAHKQG